MYLKLFCLLLTVVSSAFTQTEGTKPGLPPDQKSYSEANAVKDKPAKIAALRKFTNDFPKSTRVMNAEHSILTTLIKLEPANRKAILKQAGRLMGVAKEDRSYWANIIADLLESECTYYREAERYANKSLALLSESNYSRDMKQSYITAKLPVPSDGELHNFFVKQRSYSLLTLAEIYDHEGKQQKAEILLKGIVETVPDSYGAWFTYGKVEEGLGRPQQAGKLYLKAYIRGAAEARPKVEAAYKASHQGSVSGLDDMLDEIYRQSFPNPLRPAGYAPGAKRTDRVVLAELFTGAGCEPCVAADLTFDAAATHFARKDVAIVVYHQHVPKPDPLTNAAGIARANLYGVKGTPNFAIDGEVPAGGGGPRSSAEGVWKRIDALIEKELDTPPETKLTLEAARKENVVEVSASFDPSSSLMPEAKLFVVLVEDDVRYSGENGIRFHAMVARAVSENPRAVFNLDTITADNRKELDDFEEHSERFGKTKFHDKPVAMDAAHLGIVAFVQDIKTKKVLQAAYRGLQPGSGL